MDCEAVIIKFNSVVQDNKSESFERLDALESIYSLIKANPTHAERIMVKSNDLAVCMVQCMSAFVDNFEEAIEVLRISTLLTGFNDENEESAFTLNLADAGGLEILV